MRSKIQAVRTALAAGGILALAWGIMGAAPLPNLAAPPGLTNSAPPFTVNRFSKADRLPITRTPAVQQGKRRLIDGDYPFAAIGWQRSLAAAAPSLSKLEADDQGAFSRGCAACQTADRGGSGPI
jgi:hypothetical protein